MWCSTRNAGGSTARHSTDVCHWKVWHFLLLLNSLCLKVVCSSIVKVWKMCCLVMVWRRRMRMDPNIGQHWKCQHFKISTLKLGQHLNLSNNYTTLKLDQHFYLWNSIAQPFNHDIFNIPTLTLFNISTFVNPQCSRKLGILVGAFSMLNHDKGSRYK